MPTPVEDIRLDPLRLLSATVLTALTVASVLVGVLAFQNRGLVGQVGELRSRAIVLYPGAFVPAFVAVTDGGDTVRIGAPTPERLQLLFILNTTCPFCESTLPAWGEIAERLSGSESPTADVYAISLDSPELTTPYFAKTGSSLPWVVFPEPRIRQLFRAGQVPLTVVVDEFGQVRYARVGLIDRPQTIDSVVFAAGGAPRQAVATPAFSPNPSGSGSSP